MSFAKLRCVLMGKDATTKKGGQKGFAFSAPIRESRIHSQALSSRCVKRRPLPTLPFQEDNVGILKYFCQASES